MKPFTPTRDDLVLLAAAASLCAHAPERMRCGHMAKPLEDLRRRLAASLPKEEAPDA